ncbi:MULTISPECIES: class II lanthipeptide, LchA2/BrtA2 family [unclassified Streptomyces]|uniref:class II lanthipeptide, LchA2/BrtA2 family n=1 Tax=unclassified Streptomyces TaxID=2593676 RepID=UPI002E2AA3B2|nr:class II lanthipeptide, LchA2/BrtA2 family [Streptomyces sp. NBC_01429]
MQNEKDVLGAYDEAELIELSEADVTGGTTPVSVAVTIAASAAFCPTTKCTNSC